MRKIRVSKSEMKKIAKRYANKETPQSISEDYTFSKDTVVVLLQEHGVYRGNEYRYDYNVEFFEEKGPDYWYFLGVALTDGNISVADQKDGLAFSLSSKDADWIEKMNDVVRGAFIVRKSASKTPMGILRMYHPTICQILLEDECVPRKSLTLKMPNVPYKYFAHFLRGVIDGDGSVGFYDRGDYNIKGQKTKAKAATAYIASSSLEFLEALQASVKNYYDIDMRIKTKYEVGHIGHILGKEVVQKHPHYNLVCNNASAAKLFKHIMNVSDLELERKTKPMKEAISFYDGPDYTPPSGTNLSLADVRCMRELHDEGETYTAIAKQYGCAIETVRRAVLRRDKYGDID